MRKILILYIIRVISRITLILYPHRLSVWVKYCGDIIASRRVAYMTSNKESILLLRRPFTVLGHKYIKYKSLFSLPGLRLECIDSYREQRFSPEIILGENVYLNYRCHIGVINKIIIGDNVLIGSNVLITDHSHGYNDGRDTHIAPQNRMLYSKGPVIIEDNVWVCENVSILPGVTIGRNSIIGANSVVTKSIPPYCIASGNPAKVIREIPHDN